MTNGLLNVLKPTGITSSDAVVKLKRIFGQKKVGHMGTLDPMGAGVLIAGLGKSTRLFDYFLGKDKEYYATFRFGVETDTLDSDGTVTARTDIIPDRNAVIAALDKMTGKIRQLPPKYSAKSINGVRAYDLARRGEDFELNTREVEIKEIVMIRQPDEAAYGFRIVCSGGTYIRSIARDLAHSLGTLGVMTSIVRTRNGSFLIEKAHTLEEIADKKHELIIKPEDVIVYPVLEINEGEQKKLANGVKICADNPDGNYKIYCNGIFLGTGRISGGRLSIVIWMTE